FLRRAEAEYAKRTERIGERSGGFDTPRGPEGWFKWNGLRTPLLNEEHMESRNFPKDSPVKFNVSAGAPIPVKKPMDTRREEGTKHESGKNFKRRTGFFKWNGF
ncbi:MAG: hypothetical protein ACPGVU_18805, partial [Limisphaerales bacterium]